MQQGSQHGSQQGPRLGGGQHFGDGQHFFGGDLGGQHLGGEQHFFGGQHRIGQSILAQGSQDLGQVKRPPKPLWGQLQLSGQ